MSAGLSFLRIAVNTVGFFSSGFKRPTGIRRMAPMGVNGRARFQVHGVGSLSLCSTSASGRLSDGGFIAMTDDCPIQGFA
jgi:hypothetical protein